MAPLIRFSRNMVIIKEGERLVLVHSMRLSEPGLQALDALGKVTDVIRLAGFHGMDDPFYKERYDAKVWALEGAHYMKGFGAAEGKGEAYFEPDVRIGPDTELPIEGAALTVIPCQPPEGILRLDREGGVLITGDALQHWHRTDRYFSLAAKAMMKVMGFIKPHNVGPGWLKSAKPSAADVSGLGDLEFDNLLPVHGDPVLGGAREKYRPAIESAVASLSSG